MVSRYPVPPFMGKPIGETSKSSWQHWSPTLGSLATVVLFTDNASSKPPSVLSLRWLRLCNQSYGWPEQAARNYSSTRTPNVCDRVTIIKRRELIYIYITRYDLLINILTRYINDINHFYQFIDHIVEINHKILKPSSSIIHHYLVEQQAPRHHALAFGWAGSYLWASWEHEDEDFPRVDHG